MAEKLVHLLKNCVGGGFFLITLLCISVELEFLSSNVVGKGKIIKWRLKIRMSQCVNLLLLS